MTHKFEIMNFLKSSFFVSILALNFYSCSSSSEKTEISTQKEEIIPVIANKMLELEIEGMMCEMGCGGSIRKALKETGGVEQCSFDFDDEEEWNKAYIKFDKDKISPDKIISLIEEMNENQFTTRNPKTENYTSSVTIKDEKQGSTNAASSEEKNPIKMNNYTFSMPNLLDIFSSILKG
jgi:copper chaperone CopZ